MNRNLRHRLRVRAPRGERLMVSATSLREACSPREAKGLIPLQYEKEVYGHFERTDPPLYDASILKHRLAKHISPAAPAKPKVDLILEFLSQRKITHLLKMDQLSTPAIFRMGGIQHSFGTWWTAELKIPRPCAPEDFDRTTLRSREGVYELAIHSTSMYYIWNILVHGLVPGPKLGKASLDGVYCFPMGASSSEVQNKSKVKSSSGYAVYSGIGKDGFFWSVRLELAVARFMAGRENIGKMTAKGWISQWVCPDSTYHVTAVWFHCIHQDDFALVPTWVMFDEWHPEYEKRPANN